MLVLAYEDYPTEYLSQDYMDTMVEYDDLDIISSETYVLPIGTMEYEQSIGYFPFTNEISSLVIGDNRSITPFTEQDNAKAPCNHSYKYVTVSTHSKFSNGGCIVNVYDAKKCTKCNNIVRGSQINSYTYAVCPH